MTWPRLNEGLRVYNRRWGPIWGFEPGSKYSCFPVWADWSGQAAVATAASKTTPTFIEGANASNTVRNPIYLFLEVGTDPIYQGGKLLFMLDLKFFQQHVDVVLKIFEYFGYLSIRFCFKTLSFSVKCLLNKPLRPTDLLLGPNNLLVRNYVRNEVLSCIMVKCINLALHSVWGVPICTTLKVRSYFVAVFNRFCTG